MEDAERSAVYRRHAILKTGISSKEKMNEKEDQEDEKKNGIN